jgi:hypothetical protein
MQSGWQPDKVLLGGGRVALVDNLHRARRWCAASRGGLMLPAALFLASFAVALFHLGCGQHSTS